MSCLLKGFCKKQEVYKPSEKVPNGDLAFFDLCER